MRLSVLDALKIQAQTEFSTAGKQIWGTAIQRQNRLYYKTTIHSKGLSQRNWYGS